MRCTAPISLRGMRRPTPACRGRRARGRERGLWDGAGLARRDRCQDRRTARNRLRPRRGTEAGSPSCMAGIGNRPKRIGRACFRVVRPGNARAASRLALVSERAGRSASSSRTCGKQAAARLDKTRGGLVSVPTIRQYARWPARTPSCRARLLARRLTFSGRAPASNPAVTMRT